MAAAVVTPQQQRQLRTVPSQVTGDGGEGDRRKQIDDYFEQLPTNQRRGADFVVDKVRSASGLPRGSRMTLLRRCCQERCTSGECDEPRDGDAGVWQLRDCQRTRSRERRAWAVLRKIPKERDNRNRPCAAGGWTLVLCRIHSPAVQTREAADVGVGGGRGKVSPIGCANQRLVVVNF